MEDLKLKIQNLELDRNRIENYIDKLYEEEICFNVKNDKEIAQYEMILDKLEDELSLYKELRNN